MLRLATVVFAICSLLLVPSARSQSKPVPGTVQSDSVRITGTVRDPDGKPAPGASVSLSTATQTVVQTQADATGQFSTTAPANETYQVAASLPGLAATSDRLQLRAGETRQVDLSLQLSAVDQHVVVSASLGDLVATETASSVSVVTEDQMSDRDMQGISEVLRDLPGVAVADAGRRGGLTNLYIRGGDSKYSLVMADGIPLNQFGGDFDISPLPTDGVAQVEVVRGAESALYGPDAVTGVVNLVTETGAGAPHFDVLAEGGSFGTYRLATDGGGSFHGFSWSYDLARLASNGVVANDHYRNQTSFVSLQYSHSPRRQFVAHFFGDANDAGAPGPFGSDPDHLFPGVDTVSRDKQNLFGYQIGETEQISPRLRQVSAVSVTTDKYYFLSPFGNFFENNYKIVANTRGELTLARTDVLAAGFEYNREDYEDTFVTNAENSPFVVARTSLAPFMENRWNPSRRWTVIAGIRLDDILTGSLPPDAFGFRPFLPATNVAQVNPRGAIGYLLRQGGSQSNWGGTRLHAAGGTGIRPPDGFDLGFTDNPHLRPERSITTEVGIEQHWLGDRVVGDITYFYNRFEDQIVAVAGSSTNLSKYVTDNLNNSRAQGVELSARIQLLRSLEVSGQYTWLNTEILALNGSTFASGPYQVGQPLIRRPRNAGSYDVTWHRGRFRANNNGYVRGRTLDLEPNDGPSACPGMPCLFRNHGYFLMNAGFGIRTFRELELFGQLNNVLDQKYEEVLGFPAYGFNFMAGIRVHFSTESGSTKRP